MPGDDDSITANNTQRPASPPDGRTREDADALYAQGMAHYRRREWQEAKACFAGLKSLAPDRRGVDALLNEVDIFIQLQEMQPEGQDRLGDIGGEGVQWAETAAQQTTAARPVARRRSPWPTIVMALAVLLIVLTALYASGVLDTIIGNHRQARVQALVNKGRAAMNVGDYDRAVTAFGEALALAPKNEDVKTWYAKAQRYQQLTSLYTQAEAEIEAGQWDNALEKLDQIVALDPTYRDASEKIDFVKNQQALEALLVEAKGHFEQGNWSEAVQILEQLREQAPTFKASEVQQTLFLTYFRNGVELMAAAGDSLNMMGQAIQSFDLALDISPNDATALEERRLADAYRQGYIAFSQEDWPQAVLTLRQAYESRPDYLGGRVRSLLCISYLRLGGAYQAAGDLEQALEQYRNVLAIDGCDHREAAAKEHEVYTILHPPTPTPTRTPTLTLTPLPTPTPTATATPAPPPPPPTSPPPPTPTPER